MSKYRPVYSVEKALRILELVGSVKGCISRVYISRALGIPRPTVTNFVNTMIGLGFIERVDNGYRLGSSISVLQRYQRDTDMYQKARPMLLDMYEQIGIRSSITLSQLIAGQMMAVMHVTYREPGIVRYPVAWVIDPYLMATSLAFLSFCEPASRRQYILEHPLEEYAPMWKSTWKLYRFLVQVRRIGCAVPRINGDVHFKVAAPVWDKSRKLTAILSAGIPRELASIEVQEKCIKLICRGAAELSVAAHKARLTCQV